MTIIKMDEEKWDSFLENYDDENILNYLETLDELDKEIIIIAYQHLESSFSIERSNGYNHWLKSRISS